MKRYVFLVGAPRSGTTWLQIMLSRHSQISTCQETHLFSSFLSIPHRNWRRFESDNRGVGLQAAITRSQFLDLERKFALSVLNTIGDTPIILEKTPAHIRVLDTIREILPEAAFIHIVRDPRAVAASLAAAGKNWGSAWASTNAVKNGRLWSADVSAGLELRDCGQDTYYEIKYEDLLADPGGNLARLFSWLGLQAANDLCAQIADETRIQKLQEASTEASWNLAAEPKGFYRKGEADSWMTDLTSRDLAAVESVTGPLMESLGYSRVTRGMSALQRFRIRTIEGLAWRLNSLAKRLSQS